MTSSEEFARYMLKARAESLKVLRRYDREVGRLYLDLAGKVKAELEGASGFEQYRLQGILRSLTDAARECTNDFRGVIDKAMLQAGDIQKEAVTRGLNDYWNAMAESNIRVDPQALMFRVPREAVDMVYSRVYSDGLKLSERIWNLGRNAEQGLSRLVTEGVARGLHYDDPRIVQQVERFLQPAKLNAKTMRAQKLQKVITRKFKDGTEFTFRQRPVSYDAARLLRTEFVNAYKEASHLAAERNPACYGERWVISSFHPDIGCQCEDYATHDEGLGEGVFSLGNFPITPHPQCICGAESVVVEMNVFMDWIEDYKAGRSGVISEWWDRYGLEMAA